MRYSADRKERAGASWNSSRVGSGTACVVFYRLVCGNKGTSCARSCALVSACIGSKAELLPHGLEQLPLLPPIDHLGQGTNVPLE